jgi:LPXTG-motif cell wall-anchored protein
MGAKVLRGLGAVGLVTGSLMIVAGAAWSTPGGLGAGASPGGSGLPGELPGSEIVEEVLAVPGSAMAEPAREAPENSESDYSAAARDDDAQRQGESRDAYITRTCERILGKAPTGGLDKTTDPADGARVAPGDEVEVKLDWDPADWSGQSLHKVLDCVTINGDFVLDLSVEERPTDNDGNFKTAYKIPVEVVAGDEICDQGFLSGDSAGGGFEQDRSNQVCFKVEKDSERAAAPTPEETAPAVPPSPAQPTPVPTDVLGEQLTAPAPTPAPAPEAVPAVRVPSVVAPAPAPVTMPELVAGDTLPRTGQETRRGPLLAGGVILMLGGLGLIGGNRRPRHAASLSV